MCEIQFLMNLKNNITTDEVREFCKLMKAGSVKNHDAFGFFNSETSFKQPGSFAVDHINLTKLTKDRFIVGHNRLATTGNEKQPKNNHPFQLNEFLMVHNGVISNHATLRKEFNIPSTPETDSYVILWLINYFLKTSQATTRQKKIAYAIKKTCSKLWGWYSVFFFDKQDDNLYYFKNEMADFHFALYSNDVIVGTTNKTNLNSIFTEYSDVFHIPVSLCKIIVTPKSNTIYMINTDVGVKKIGTFTDGDDAPCEQGCSYSGYSGEEQWIFEQSVMDYLTERLGYCPDFTISEDGDLRVRVDSSVKTYVDLMFSRYQIEDGWIESHIDCLEGIHEYLEGWY